MSRIEDLPEPVSRHMSVQLRRREVCVTEQLLDDAQICTPFEQVRGERVAQFVGVRGPGGTGVDDTAKVTRRELAPPTIQEERVVGGASHRFDPVRRAPPQHLAPMVSPLVECLTGRFVDGDDPLLGALPPDAQSSVVVGEVAEAHPAELGGPQSAAVEQLDEAGVAVGDGERDRIVGGGRRWGEEPIDLGFGEDLG
jgi:hypothetical protein